MMNRSWYCTKWISVLQKFIVSQGKRCMLSFARPVFFRCVHLFTWISLLYWCSHSRFKVQRIYRRQYNRFMSAVKFILFCADSRAFCSKLKKFQIYVYTNHFHICSKLMLFLTACESFCLNCLHEVIALVNPIQLKWECYKSWRFATLTIQITVQLELFSTVVEWENCLFIRWSFESIENFYQSFANLVCGSDVISKRRIGIFWGLLKLFDNIVDYQRNCK